MVSSGATHELRIRCILPRLDMLDRAAVKEYVTLVG